jgi:cell division protein FtsB
MVFGHNGILKYRELAAIRASYEKRIEETDKKVKTLTDELNLVRKDKDYLEMLIKKDLNMKKQDEDLYIIEKKPDQKKSEKSK